MQPDCQQLIYNKEILIDSEYLKSYQALENESKLIMGLRGFREVDASLRRSDENCSIMHENFKDDGVIVLKMPCTHSISPDSLMDYVWSEVSAKKNEVKCPLCSDLWSFSTIKKYGGAVRAELDLLEKALSDNFCLNSDEINQCPKCQSYITRQNPTVNSVVCIVCSKNNQSKCYFCWHCLGEWKTPLSSKVCGNDCKDEAKLALLLNCEEVSIKYLKIKVPSIRACPYCGSMIELADGCKHVDCAQCKTKFCFNCLRTKSNGSWSCGRYNTECETAPRQTKIPLQCNH